MHVVRAVLRQLMVLFLTAALALVSGYALAAADAQVPVASWKSIPAFSMTAGNRLADIQASYSELVNYTLRRSLGFQAALLPREPTETRLIPSNDVVIGRPLEEGRPNQPIGPSSSVPLELPKCESSRQAPKAETEPSPTDESWAPVNYSVKKGENLLQICRRFGVSPQTVADVNALRNPDYLRVGQKLVIPPTDGRMYEVERGDVLWELSDSFGVSVGELMEANGLADPSELHAGQLLFVPGAVDQKRANASAAAFNSRSSSLAWPVARRGRISSPFGRRLGTLHTGVDIAVPPGTPILAAAPGRVLSARWLGAYGRAVVLLHPASKWKTLYAHASRTAVEEGQWVKEGELLGYVGSTGRSTGPHLHFEVIINGRPRDPLQLVSYED